MIQSLKKHIALFLAFSFIFNTLSSSQTQLIDKAFHPDTLKHWVSLIASDSMFGRYTGSTGGTKTSILIATEFSKAGLLPIAGNTGYFMQAGTNWFNIMGAIPGKNKSNELVIFSAHYDHIGTTTTNPSPQFGGKAFVEDGDTIYNGANDNASGTVAMLRLAHYFKLLGQNERTILFIAFGGEEQGLIGSSYLAEQFTTDSIIAMINIEMIGRKSPGLDQPYITDDGYKYLQRILNSNLSKLDKSKYGKNYFRDDYFPNAFLFARSDNYPFALKGVPAHTIMATSPNDEYYHNLNDEPFTLDFKFMSEVVTAIALASTGIVNGKDTPARD